MSQEQFPQPEQRPSPQEHSEHVEGSFSRDEANIQEGLRYVDEVAPNWVLEPAEVPVEQPANQEELVDNLDSMLGSQQDGEQLQRHLQGNLAMIRSKQAQPESSGFGRLNIKAGYNVNDLRRPGDNLSKEEYETLRDNSQSEREIVDDPDQPNVMVTGLLTATGAEVLRDDVGEDGGIKRIYKGVLDGRPVYFEEMVLPRIRGDFDPNREKTTYLERTFNVVSEHTARHSLNMLSAKDAEVLRSIGVEFPAFYSGDYNPDTYPNRSRMIETLQLYASMNPSVMEQQAEMYSSDMETTALLGEVSKPETRRYTSDEQYRFLVHTVLDDPKRTFDYLSRNQPEGFRIDSDKPLNTSLVDQEHTATFEGASGLIIQPSEKTADISGIWPGDVAVDIQTDGKPNMTGLEALAATKQGEYNQVHLKAGKVEGVFIRVAADTGKELGFPQTNQALRDLAAEHGLPVAEIMVNPRQITEAEPVVKDIINTGNGELHQIVLPHNGYEYKIDVVKQVTGQDVSFADAEGFAMRMAKIDGYDVWDRNLTNDDLASIQARLATLRQSNPEIVQHVERQIAELRNKSDEA